MIGMILQSEILPVDARILGDTEYKGRQWFKIKGVLDQSYVNNWLRYRGLYKLPIAPTIYADPMDIVKIIPDEALAELQDLAGEKGKDKKDRGKAYKITTILGQSQPIEVSNDEFDGYLVFMRDHADIPTFDQIAMDDVKLKLGIE